MFKNAKIALATISAIAVTATTSVYAALPANIATDVAEAKVDMLSAIGMVIGAMVAVWGLKKLAQKLGWL